MKVRYVGKSIRVDIVTPTGTVGVVNGETVEVDAKTGRSLIGQGTFTATKKES